MRQDRSLRPSWPLYVAGSLLLAIFVTLYVEAVRRCGGHYGYPMDDTYIHMAMARTLSQDGVWGLTKYGFSSSSSSPLYTTILAVIYKVAGVNESAPLILNVVFGFALLWFADYALRDADITAGVRLGWLIAISLAMPLAPEMLAGMEHVLHTLLVLMFVFVAVHLLGRPAATPIAIASLLTLGALTTMARYESLALMAVTALLFAIERRWRLAAATVVVPVIPVGLFGLYSMHEGWLAVPVSIVAKVSRPERSVWPYPVHWAEQLVQVPGLMVVSAVALVLLAFGLARHRWRWTRADRTLMIFLGVLLLHMEFARVGWFFRYEAYLVVLGLYAVGIGAQEAAREGNGARSSLPRFFEYAVGFAALLSVAPRITDSLWLTPYASQNIHDQQYQMGLFLKQHAGQEAVVLNDIGAAGFLSNARIVDLYGLANIDVARAKVHHQYTQEFRRELARATNAKMGILYPGEFEQYGGLPTEWIPVGSWTIPENQICWSKTVIFYAIDPAYREKLEAALRDFAASLPAGVTQAGSYVQNNTAIRQVSHLQ